MTPENRKYNIAQEWSRAQESLKIAELTLRESLYSGSVAASYYYAFHCGRALLMSAGLEARSHAGVQHLINTHFIRTGKIKPDIGSVLPKLEESRLNADYEAAVVFTAEMATTALQKARVYGAEVEAFLQAAGYL